MNHDQNFKNLILDYPLQALRFFAADETGDHFAEAEIIPIRQEQLKERLGDRFRELDVPLLVQWPGGHRAALLFVLEEETDASRFSIHRLGHYCLDLAELFKTDRVVPVVIFLRGGAPQYRLELGGERRTYLSFEYIACELASLPYEAHRDSENIVARLNLPNMQHSSEQKVDAYAHAIRGLIDLEQNPEKQLKYFDFIDIYADLDENDRQRYQRDYPQEAAIMGSFSQRFIQQGIEQGIERGIERGIEQGIEQGIQQGERQGVRKGEAKVLLTQLRLKFGDIPAPIRQRIDDADADTLLLWSERILSAERMEQVIGDDA